MKIAIACEAGVYQTKQIIISKLLSLGHTVIDCGPDNSNFTHYPIYGRRLALVIAKHQADFGVAICGTGIGISNSVGKVKNIRCVPVRDIYTARLAREKYNANVIACGAKTTGIDTIIEIITTFLKASYNHSNKKIIDVVDNQIKTLNDDSKLFDSILSDWEDGNYTAGKKQRKIIVSPIKILIPGKI